MSLTNITSPLGASLQVAGTVLLMGNGSSPETMFPIANTSDLSLPVIADTVDVTNFGDQFHRRRATLGDMGKITFKIFWIPEEATHRNSAGGGATAEGLRYLLVNFLKRDFAFVYPTDTYPNGATDAFPAYVTSFAITGKVGGVFEGAIELSNDGPPQLC